jgi:hypothetical protein
MLAYDGCRRGHGCAVVSGPCVSKALCMFFVPLRRQLSCSTIPCAQTLVHSGGPYIRSNRAREGFLRILGFRCHSKAKSFVRGRKIDPPEAPGRVFDFQGRSCGCDRRCTRVRAWRGLGEGSAASLRHHRPATQYPLNLWRLDRRVWKGFTINFEGRPVQEHVGTTPPPARQISFRTSSLGLCSLSPPLPQGPVETSDTWLGCGCASS